MALFNDFEAPFKKENANNNSRLPELSHCKLYDEYCARVEELERVLALAESPSDLSSEYSRTKIFAHLSYGLRKAGEAMAWIVYHKKMAYVSRKEAESLAAMDDYNAYIALKKSSGDNERATVEGRKLFMNMSERVIKANREEAAIEAMAEHISTLRSEFIQSISTLRSLFYGIKDSSYLSSASVFTENGGQ